MIKLFLKMIFVPQFGLALIKQKKQIKKFSHNKVNIGLNCSIKNSKLEYRTMLSNNVTILNSSLGKHSYINSNTSVANAKIGNFCSIASNVIIGMGYHPTNFISTHPAFYANNKAFKTYSDKVYINEYKETIIGNDVWICTGVYIPGGVTIGDGAIITAGAIVTKDVPPYAIVGGVPAKIIRYRFNQDEIKKLENIKWWNMSEDWFKNNYKLFHNPSKFFEYFENNREVKDV